MIILLSFTTFQWPLQRCIQSYYIDQLFDRLLVNIKYCRAWQIFTYHQRSHSCSPHFYWILWIHILLPFPFLWDHLCVYILLPNVLQSSIIDSPWHFFPISIGALSLFLLDVYKVHHMTWRGTISLWLLNHMSLLSVTLSPVITLQSILWFITELDFFVL